MSEKVTFGSKAGLIASTVGSAVGLGNVWRFPAETQANGGAAFLIVYIFCVFLFGIPVMTAEFSLGRGGRSDATGAFLNITPKRRNWRAVGALTILASYLILSFYMVVSGWTLEYLIQSLSGALYDPVPQTAGLTPDAADHVQFSTRMGEYITGTTRPLVMTYLMLAANLGVLMLGVQKGIEKVSNILMPLLFALLVVLVCVSLSLPGAGEGVRFFLNPDFSAVTPSTVIDAMGQAFFSLSLAMGILITYASYFPAKTKLTRTAVTVSLLDLLVAVMMGLIIFPGVMTYGLSDQSLAGSALVFVTLPEIFARMDGTIFWSPVFFLLLTVAAFTSTISLAEVSVSFARERWGMSRRNACLAVILPLFALSTVCSLSVGPWSGCTIAGMTIFDFLDTVTSNIMLPVGGILICIYMGWVAPRNFFGNEMSNYGKMRSYVFPLIYFIVKWIAPVLISIILINSFIN